jgi:hypothetical protein
MSTRAEKEFSAFNVEQLCILFTVKAFIIQYFSQATCLLIKSFKRAEKHFIIISPSTNMISAKILYFAILVGWHNF